MTHSLWLGEIQWFWWKIFQLGFKKNAPACPRGWTAYLKNQNNFVECFKMAGNRQKCRKFSRLNRFLKLQESIDQYLMHVKISKFSKFRQFFRFFNWLPTPDPDPDLWLNEPLTRISRWNIPRKFSKLSVNKLPIVTYLIQ